MCNQKIDEIHQFFPDCNLGNSQSRKENEYLKSSGKQKYTFPQTSDALEMEC